jgi:hypothetical protein
MCENDSEKSEHFSNLRAAFKELTFDEKAAFLVESAVGVVIDGARRAGEVVAESFENVSTAPAGDASSEDESEAEQNSGEKKDTGKNKNTGKKSPKSSKDEGKTETD